METLEHMNAELVKILHSGVELTMSRLPLPEINLVIMLFTLLIGIFWLLVMCMLAPEEEDKRRYEGKRDEDLKGEPAPKEVASAPVDSASRARFEDRKAEADTEDWTVQTSRKAKRAQK